MKNFPILARVGGDSRCLVEYMEKGSAVFFLLAIVHSDRVLPTRHSRGTFFCLGTVSGSLLKRQRNETLQVAPLPTIVDSISAPSFNFTDPYALYPIPTPVQTPYDQYTRLLGDSLLFYEMQRSGKLVNNRIPWRHDSGLADGADNRVDLVGGYYDAGDYVKATFPLSFTLNLINWGALEYFQGYVLADQAGNLKDMVKWGTDWLIKAHNANNSLYVQVGDGWIDNNYWGPDTNIPSPRRSFRVDPLHPGTDVAAETAAAFASSSLLFRRHFSSPDYAALLLQHSKELFQFAMTPPLRRYSQDRHFLYSSSGFGDELLWSALWMYRATRNETYFELAREFLDTYGLGDAVLPVDWDSKHGAAYVLGAALSSGLDGLPVLADAPQWRALAESYLDRLVDGVFGTRTPDGLFWFDGSSENNSLPVSQATSLLCFLYSSTTLRAHPLGKISNSTVAIKAAKYEEFATKQLEYLLGNNSAGRVYVVGEHPSSPKNPHHAGAHGGTHIHDLMNPALTTNVLLGAVVAGPDRMDSFIDDRRIWTQTEPALDYNAPFQCNVARQVLYATKPPRFIRQPVEPPSLQPTSGWRNEYLCAILIPLLVGLPAMGAFLWWWQRRRRERTGKHEGEFRMGEVNGEMRIPKEELVGGSPGPSACSTQNDEGSGMESTLVEDGDRVVS
ncbi:uncharacterized protein VTP21DRAFT_644 [Calcarisporiella thermophila]|uniref:uncharacterized protein n=1 Tax=Calcarisporiella thermophila TaxID=911321 RepID=UPI00374392F9